MIIILSIFRYFFLNLKKVNRQIIRFIELILIIELMAKFKMKLWFLGKFDFEQKNLNPNFFPNRISVVKFGLK